MIEFEYPAPNSIECACAFPAENGESTKILAGGTDLLIDLKKGFAQPKYLLDVMGIPELKTIKDLGDSIFIGAAVTVAELARNPITGQFVSFLCQAAGSIGSPQIRNAATIGGNIVNASPCADSVPPFVALQSLARLRSAEGENEILLPDLIRAP